MVSVTLTKIKKGPHNTTYTVRKVVTDAAGYVVKSEKYVFENDPEAASEKRAALERSSISLQPEKE